MRLAGMVTKVKRSRSMYPEDTWTNGQQIGCSNTEQFHVNKKKTLTQSALMFSSSHCVPYVCVCSVYISCRSILVGDPAGFFLIQSLYWSSYKLMHVCCKAAPSFPSTVTAGWHGSNGWDCNSVFQGHQMSHSIRSNNHTVIITTETASLSLNRHNPSPKILHASITCHKHNHRHLPPPIFLSVSCAIDWPGVINDINCYLSFHLHSLALLLPLMCCGNQRLLSQGEKRYHQSSLVPKSHVYLTKLHSTPWNAAPPCQSLGLCPWNTVSFFILNST